MSKLFEFGRKILNDLISKSVTIRRHACLKRCKVKNGIILLTAAVLFVACSDSKYENAEDVSELSISFNDPQWDGILVPEIGQCKNCGGGGLSPALKVKNIPKEADLLIVEFNDKTMPSLSKDGGHGAIRLPISGKGEFVVPAVNEQTFDLPAGIEMESQHRAPLGNPGVYMAPCGCGSGNKYEAEIMAVKSAPSGPGILVGRGKINLGRF